MIGEVIKGRPRDSYYIATKVNLPQDRTKGLYTEAATTEEFLKRLDISLKRLGIDYVDILHLHGVSRKESVVYEPALKGFEKAKKDGKIRFVGLSTHANEPEVIHAATDSKAYDVILTAYTFKQKHAAEVRDAIARASQAGIGIIAMKAVRGANQQPPINKKYHCVLQMDASGSKRSYGCYRIYHLRTYRNRSFSHGRSDPYRT